MQVFAGVGFEAQRLHAGEFIDGGEDCVCWVLELDESNGTESLPWSSKAGSAAVWRKVGSYSRDIREGSEVSVAIVLESRGARHC
jgi:hypothetical protein